MKHLKMVLINAAVFIACYYLYNFNVWLYNFSGNQLLLMRILYIIMAIYVSFLWNYNYVKGVK